MKQTFFQIETLNHYAISLVSEYRLTSKGKAYMLYDVNMGNRILHITECEEESVSVYSFVIYDDFVLQNINIENYISRRETIYLDINIYDVISFLRSIEGLGLESRYELVAKFKFYANSILLVSKGIIDPYVQRFIAIALDNLAKKLGYGIQEYENICSNLYLSKRLSSYILR